MNKTSFILILILLFLIIIFYIKKNKNIIYIKSYIDGEYYLVRDVSDKQLACETLAKIKKNILLLNNYLYKNRYNNNYKEYIEYIEQLNERIKDVKILESDETSVYTSYSINKGEEIVFCLRSNIRVVASNRYCLPAEVHITVAVIWYKSSCSVWFNCRV